MKKLFIILFLLIISSKPTEAVKYAQLGGGSGSTCSLASPCTIDTVFGQISTSEDIILLGGTETRTALIDWNGKDGTALDRINVSCSGVCKIEGGEHITSWTKQSTNVYRGTLTNTPYVPADGYKGYVWNHANPTWITNETNSGDLGSGEYYINSGSKYIEIYVDDDTDPDTWTPPADFIVPLYANRVIHLRNVDYLTWDMTNTFIGGSAYRGFEIGSGVSSGYSVDNVTVKNGEIAYCSEGCVFLNALTGSLYTNILFENMNIHHVVDNDSPQGTENGHCFKFGSGTAGLANTATLRNSQVNNCIRNGVWASAGVQNVVIDGNTIHSVNMDNANGAAGIGCNSGDITNCDIINNTIYGGDNTTGSSGIYLTCTSTGAPGDTDVNGNRIYNHSDFAVSMFSNSCSGSFTDLNFFNNIIYNNSNGVKIDLTTDFKFYSNTLVDNGNYNVRLNSGSADGGDFKNNIMDQGNGAESLECNGSPTISDEDYNIVRSTGTARLNAPCTTAGSNSNSTAADFTDRSGKDFTLVAGNGYEDGTCLSSPFNTSYRTDDIRQSPCDMGAHESSDVFNVSAANTGTLSDGANESDIVSGSQTLIITLTNDTWVATVGADNAITDALIDGIDSDKAESTGWDAVVKANMDFNDVVRTSSTVVTITLGAESTYSISSDEVISVTIPATALTDTGSDLPSTPSFTITNQEVPGDNSAKLYNATLSNGELR